MIKNVPGLLLALEELHAMIELETIKREIIKKIKFLIVGGPSGSLGGFDGHLLHIFIFGSPGSGKTHVAKIISKIWYHLGLFNPKSRSPRDLRGSGGAGKSRLNALMGNMATNTIKDFVTSYQITALKKTIQSQEDQLRQIQAMAEEHRRLLSITRSRLHSMREITEAPLQEEINQILSDTRKLREVMEKLDNLSAVKPKEEEPVEGSLQPAVAPLAPTSLGEFELVVVSRQHFVAEFSGQTETKTLELLTRCLGKVLFIDEAYTLVRDDKDGFGIIALDIINQFMTEHSDEIIIIFAGYKELMEKTIFKMQPGLLSRAGAIFEITGYSPESLGKIMVKQLTERGWSLGESIDLSAFFLQHHSAFPAFGRDVHRLVYQCKSIYKEQAFDRLLTSSPSSDPLSYQITSSILEQAFQEFLQQNQIIQLSPPFPAHMYI